MSDLTTKAAEIRAGLVAEQAVAEWRAAMEGVTPGPWMMEIEADDRVAESGEDRQPEVYVCSERTACDYTVVATMGRAESIPHMRKSFDADWIARCSPAGIAPLLALIAQQAATIEAVEKERDEAREFAAVQNGGNKHASSEWTRTLLKLRASQKERDSLMSAGEALSLALSRYGFPMSDEAWRNTGDDAPANSQASVEARALHRAAVAFFREVSGAGNVG